MAGGFKIAEGYLDIEADTDAALKDVRAFFKEVDKELDAEEKAFKKSGEKSGKGFVDGAKAGAKDADKVFKKVAEDALSAVESESNRRGGLLGSLFGRMGGKAAKSAFSLKTLFPSGSQFANAFRGIKGIFRGAGGLLGDLFDFGKDAFKNITTGVADALKTGFNQAKEIWEGASKAFQKIGDIGGGIGSVAMFGAFAIGIPLVVGLAGALIQLSAAAFALPAALGVLVAAIAPVIVAFQGFGAAVGAGLSGDMQKFNEALKGLAPNARAVAKEFVKLGPALKGIKQQTQNAFFGPLVGQISKLGTTLLPALASGMSQVGGAMGRLTKLFVDLLSAPGTVKMLNDLFSTTARIIGFMSEPFINFLGGVFALIQAGLPWVEKFAHVLADGLQAGADWLQKISSNGQLNTWLQKAWDTGKELWRVLKDLGEYVLLLFGSFGDEGTDTLSGIANQLERVNTYLKSKEGQETLHNLGVLIHWAGDAFVWLLSGATGTYRQLNAMFNLIRGIGPWLKGIGHWFADLGRSIADAGKSVGKWFVDLWHSITGGVGDATSSVGGFFSGIGKWFSDAWDSVVSFGAGIVDWFTALPGKIGEFFAALPGNIANFFGQLFEQFNYAVGYLAGVMIRFWVSDLPRWISEGWAWVTNAVSTGIDAVINFVTALPGRTWDALKSLGSTIGNAVVAAWNWAKDATTTGIDAVIDFASKLPGRIWGAISSLGETIGGIVSRAWDRAVSATISGFFSVLQWFHDLPGAVGRALSGAGTWLYNAGKDVLRGLIDGLKDMLGWAVDKARDAANAIKRGFLDGLDIGSPSQVMRKEVGRWILPGVMQGMDDSMKDFDKYLGATVELITGGFRPVVNVGSPNVSVGGTTLIADLGDGIQQAVPAALMRNPTTVATAASIGNRRNAAWVNTGRPAVTGV